jgi:MFS family permease
MSGTEKRAAFGLAGIYGLRMLGLFLILPVFALYAEHLPEATPLLIGLAVGIYGLTQALLQIPFGLLSDRIGRKPVILGGLALFALGSVIAATATDIVWVIVGRAVQGSGAIAAAIMALAADLTRESHRTKAMALVGMTIGLSFMVALMAGPALNAWIGVPGIFWLTGALALAGMTIVVLIVPTPVRQSVHRDAEPVPALLGRVLRDPQLLRLDFGIFSLHLILTALFLGVPLALRDAGLPSVHHSWLYLPVMLLSLAAMLPFIMRAERGGRFRSVFLGAVGLLAVAELLIRQALGNLWLLALAIWLFFTAFNLLEAMLPSLVSRLAPADAKGSAMGVYSTSQFAGAFIGGLAGGWMHQHFGQQGLFLFGMAVAVLWFLVALGMSAPGKFRAELLRVGPMSNENAGKLSARLGAIRGVAEAVVVPDEGVAYLKINPGEIDRAALDAFAAPGA